MTDGHGRGTSAVGGEDRGHDHLLPRRAGGGEGETGRKEGWESGYGERREAGKGGRGRRGMGGKGETEGV